MNVADGQRCTCSTKTNRLDLWMHIFSTRYPAPYTLPKKRCSKRSIQWIQIPSHRFISTWIMCSTIKPIPTINKIVSVFQLTITTNSFDSIVLCAFTRGVCVKIANWHGFHMIGFNKCVMGTLLRLLYACFFLYMFIRLPLTRLEQSTKKKTKEKHMHTTSNLIHYYRNKICYAIVAPAKHITFDAQSFCSMVSKSQTLLLLYLD